MATLETLRRRVEGVQDMHGVVRAMKSLSAVRIRQCRQAAEALTAYADTVELGLRAALRARPPAVRTAREAPAGDVLLVAFGSDQGLVGGYNARIAEAALARGRQFAQPMVVVGNRLAHLLDASGVSILARFSSPRSPDALTPVVNALLLSLDERRTSHGVSRWELCYTHQVPGAGTRPQCVPLEPLDQATSEALARQPWPTNNLPSFRGSWEGLLAAIMRERLRVALSQALLAALTNEHLSRLAAMQAAEERIETRLVELGRDYREQTQQAITEELQEITAGFRALRRRRRPVPRHAGRADAPGEPGGRK